MVVALGVATEFLPDTRFLEGIDQSGQGVAGWGLVRLVGVPYFLDGGRWPGQPLSLGLARSFVVLVEERAPMPRCVPLVVGWQGVWLDAVGEGRVALAGSRHGA